MTPITRDEIEELERKAKAATEGPWFPHDFTEAPSDSPPSAHDVAVSCTTPDHILVASMGGGLWGPRGDAGILQAKLDADYIAAAHPATTLALIARIRELESAIRPFADYANAINDKWPDSTGTSLLFKQTDGSLQNKPNISLGDCRIAAAVLAKGGA